MEQKYMPAEELSHKYFSRERVRSRILKRAAEAWGYAESEMDDFDPLVTLLIEACSVEFEKISSEIGNSENRMLERLAELLYPGMIDTHPSFGIIQVRSSEPRAVLDENAQFFYKSSGKERKNETQAKEIFFSPAKPVHIFDAGISYIATARDLFSITDGVQKELIGSAVKTDMGFQRVVWLGLDINEEIESLDEMSFFFNWPNHPESRQWYNYLGYTEWKLNDSVLPKKNGVIPGQDGEHLQSHLSLEKEFDPLMKIEDHVVEMFGHHFITLKPEKRVRLEKLPRALYPKPLEQFFDKKTLQELKEPLCWLEIHFPSTIPEEALESAIVSLNAVPVINRKLNRFTYKLGQSLNIVPLETDDIFLSIKEITNSEGRKIKLVPFANLPSLTPETYTLRFGMNRFDKRDSVETLTNLTELIKEESSYFSSLGENFLSEHIRELRQVLARMEANTQLQKTRLTPFPYLAIKSKQEGGTISVEYWSSNGESANKIPMGASLISYKSSNVLSNSCFFITSTYAGRNKMNEREKMEEYKKSLLMHNRVVTREDLKLFMQTELSERARSIEYMNTYIKSDRPNEGFIQCVQIVITPEPGKLELAEWDQLLISLQLKLQKQSVNNIPYHLKLSRS